MLKPQSWKTCGGVLALFAVSVVGITRAGVPNRGLATASAASEFQALQQAEEFEKAVIATDAKLVGLEFQQADEKLAAEGPNVFCIHPDVIAKNLILGKWLAQIESSNPSAIITDAGNSCVIESAISRDQVDKLKSAITLSQNGPLLRDARAGVTYNPAIREALNQQMDDAIASANGRGKIKPPRHHTFRNSVALTGVAFAGFGILLMMPESITKWSKDQSNMKNAFKHLKRAWTSPPVWDHDDWQINYIGHPIAGSYYYAMERNYGESWLRSALFAVAASTSWEYIPEAFAERPSIQDLIFTPLVGSIMGEGVHRLTEKMRANGFSITEKIVLTIVNPVYVAQRGYRAN